MVPSPVDKDLLTVIVQETSRMRVITSAFTSQVGSGFHFSSGPKTVSALLIAWYRTISRVFILQSPYWWLIFFLPPSQPLNSSSVPG